MALAIANIPVLEGADAERFVHEANENLKFRGTESLSVTYEDLKKIMSTARF